jgi:23S rRNA (adenine2503-C2)-methyltransferase
VTMVLPLGQDILRFRPAVLYRASKISQGHYQYNLAISLHAPNDELRQKLMPVDQAYPLDVLMDSIERIQ